jgi:hypothetical protein
MADAGERTPRTAGRRVDWRELSRRATGPFLAFALLSWAIAGWVGSQRPEPDLLPFLKRAWPMADFTRLPSGAWEVERRGELVGHAAWGRGAGYGGAIVVAIGVEPRGAVASAAFLEYRDTPDLMRSTRALLASFLGRPASEPFEVGRDVDAVTGATASTRGVAAATRDALAKLPAGGDSAPGATERVAFGAAEVALLVLMAGGVVAGGRSPLRGRPLEIARRTTQLASLVTIGFLFDRPWVIALPLRLLTGEIPSWRTHLYGYLLLVYLLVVFARSGRNPYCPWLCARAGTSTTWGSRARWPRARTASGAGSGPSSWSRRRSSPPATTARRWASATARTAAARAAPRTPRPAPATTPASASTPSRTRS